MKKIALLLFLILALDLNSQVTKLFNLDNQKFPEMRANFLTIDSSGNKITNVNISDLTIIENNETKQILDFTPFNNSQSISLSCVLMIDVSSSMQGNRLNLAKFGSTQLFNLLDLGYDNCLINSFNNQPYLNLDFSTNKNSLSNVVKSLYSSNPCNIDSAFNDSQYGGLALASTGTNKRIIIFITSAINDLKGSTQAIINKALAANITIYGICLNGFMPSKLREITQNTGGDSYEYIYSSNDLLYCLTSIYQTAKHVNGYGVVWQSDYYCSNENYKVKLSYSKKNIADSTYVYPNSNNFIHFESIPSTIIFKNTIPGKSYDTVISLKSYNNDLNINSIYSDNPAFEISPKMINLIKNKEAKINLKFTPKDEFIVSSNITFFTNRCKYTITATGGEKIKTSNNYIKILQPNGGEKLKSGDLTCISWDANNQNDEYSLKYSINSGKDWNTIIDRVKGNKYFWTVPKQNSNNCLIKVSKIDKPYNINWIRFLGGSGDDYLKKVIKTKDGGVLVAGTAISNDGDIVKNHGQKDAWLIKLNAQGITEWQKCYGGSNDDDVRDICETSDGGFAFVGSSHSFDGDLLKVANNKKVWVVKINNSGDITGQKLIGSNYYDEGLGINPTNDGGYVVTSEVMGKGGDVENNNGGSDGWIVKLDADLNIIWSNNSGGEGTDNFFSINNAVDGSVYAGGWTYSHTGEFADNNGEDDAYLVKLDSTGEKIWEKHIGGKWYDCIRAVTSCKDASCIAAGFSSCSNRGPQGTLVPFNAFVVKYSSNGTEKWYKYIGGPSDEFANDIVATKEGGCVITGYSSSNTGDFSGNQGGNDAFIIKLDSNGRTEETILLGGNGSEMGSSLAQIDENNYVVAGISNSSSGIFEGNIYKKNCFVISINTNNVTHTEDVSDSCFSIGKPMLVIKDIDFNQIKINSIKDTLVKAFIDNQSSTSTLIEKIYIKGEDKDLFTILNKNNTFFIDSLSAFNLNIRINPSKLGAYLDTLVVITNTDSLTALIKAYSTNGKLSLNTNKLVFDSTYILETSSITDYALLNNISNQTVNITKTYILEPNSNQFEIVNGGGAFSLAPNESRKVSIKFKPTLAGKVAAKLGFEYSGTDSPIICNLSGYCIFPIISAPKDTMAFNEEKNLKFIYKKFKSIYNSNVISDYSADLILNPNIIKVIDSQYQSEILNGNLIVHVRNKISPTDSGFTLKLKVINNNFGFSFIDFKNSNFYDNTGKIFEVDHYVESGFIRLRNFTSVEDPNAYNFSIIKEIKPNPMNNNFSIEYKILGNDNYEYSILNELGGVVMSGSFEVDCTKDSDTKIIGVNELVSGNYLFILKSSKGVDFKNIIILK